MGVRATLKGKLGEKEVTRIIDYNDADYINPYTRGSMSEEKTRGSQHRYQQQRPRTQAKAVRRGS